MRLVMFTRGDPSELFVGKIHLDIRESSSIGVTLALLVLLPHAAIDAVIWQFGLHDYSCKSLRNICNYNVLHNQLATRTVMMTNSFLALTLT